MPRFLIGVILLCSGCAAPDLGALRTEAGVTRTTLVQTLQGTSMQVETEIRTPGGEVIGWHGTVRHGDGVVRVESWRHGAPWDEGYVRQTAETGTQLWEVGGTGAIHLPVIDPPQLQRWFDWSALAVVEGAGSLVGDRELVDGRPCHHVTLLTERAQGQPRYLLRAAEGDAWLQRALAGDELKVLQVEEEGGLTTLRAVEQRGRLGEALGHTTTWTPGDPCAWASRSVDVVGDLWIDEQTLLPARLDGWLQVPGRDGASEVSVVWSDVRSIADGVAYPHRLDYHVDGQLLATSRVIAIEPDTTEIRTHVPHAHADLEHLVQNNHTKRLHAIIDNPDKEHGGWEEGKDEAFQPQRVLELPQLEAGDTVADIGAGSGYFTFKLARAVGPTGRSLAIDVNQHALDSMEDKVADPTFNPHGNVERRVDRFDDVDLPDQSLDAALVCDVGFVRFRNLSRPARAMLRSIHAACRPGARVISIEKLKLGFEDTVLGLGWAVVPFPIRVGREQRAVDPFVEPDGDVLVVNYRDAGFVPVEHHDFVDLYDLWVFERR